MKKTLKRLLFSGMALSLLLFLSGCVKTEKGIPTGEGWVYNFLVKPMGIVIQYFANDLNLGYGFAIIIVTLIVRICIILPLGLYQSWKSSYQTEKMAYLKPIFGPIQERMQNATSQEERLAAQTELMALQREYGISMFGGIGCLPLLVQMPFFSALFYAARYTEGVADATFFGISLGKTNFYLAILTGLLYLFQSWLTVKSVPEEQRQQMRSMMLMTPLMMIFFTMSSPAGVALYWLVGGVMAIIQQLLVVYVVRPILRKRIDEEFEKNPPKIHPQRPNSNGRKDVTPNQSQQKAISNNNKKKRNAGKQRSR